MFRNTHSGETNVTTMVWVYLTYLAICILVTALVARTLRNHGAVFMAGKDSGESPLIRAKTHLLVVGFYLVTLGMVGFALKYGGDADDAKTAIEILSTKIGGVVLLIGVLHFLMVAVFASIRRESYSPPSFVVAKTVD